jgi:hypothetical protein
VVHIAGNARAVASSLWHNVLQKHRCCAVAPWLGAPALSLSSRLFGWGKSFKFIVGGAKRSQAGRLREALVLAVPAFMTVARRHVQLVLIAGMHCRLHQLPALAGSAAGPQPAAVGSMGASRRHAMCRDW